MRLTNRLDNGFVVCSLLSLTFYLCVGLLFVIAGCGSPGFVSEPSELIPDVLPDGMINPSQYIPFTNDSELYYNSSELYQTALNVFNWLTIGCLSVIMILTFVEPAVRYVIELVKNPCKECDYPMVLSPVLCLFVWYVPALMLNVIAKWMVCNQDISAEQMIIDISGFDSLLTLQTVIFVICTLLYVLPMIIEVILAVKSDIESKKQIE